MPRDYPGEPELVRRRQQQAGFAIERDMAGAVEGLVGPESPVFTGTPQAPTPAPGTNSEQIATTAFVAAAIAALVDTSPAALDTLNELAGALGDDPNFATTVLNALGGKQPLDAQLSDMAALVYAGNALKVLRVNAAETGLELAAASGGGGSFTMTTVEVDLGSVARRSGRFIVGGLSGLVVGKPVLMHQAVGPYTGKGARADEAEADQLSVAASVTSNTEITGYWRASGPMRGIVKLNYAIGS